MVEARAKTANWNRLVASLFLLQHSYLLEGGPPGKRSAGETEESLPLGRSELKQPISECPASSPEEPFRTECVLNVRVTCLHLPPGRFVQAGRWAHLPGRSRGLPGVGLRHRSPRAATSGIGPQEPPQYSGRRPRRHEVSKGSTRLEVGLQSTLARDLARGHFGKEEQRAEPKQPISEGAIPHGPLEVVVHGFRPLPGRKLIHVQKCQVWEGYVLFLQLCLVLDLSSL